MLEATLDGWCLGLTPTLRRSSHDAPLHHCTDGAVVSLRASHESRYPITYGSIVFARAKRSPPTPGLTGIDIATASTVCTATRGTAFWALHSTPAVRSELHGTTSSSARNPRGPGREKPHRALGGRVGGESLGTLTLASTWCDPSPAWMEAPPRPVTPSISRGVLSSLAEAIPRLTSVSSCAREPATGKPPPLPRKRRAFVDERRETSRHERCRVVSR